MSTVVAIIDTNIAIINTNFANITTVISIISVPLLRRSGSIPSDRDFFVECAEWVLQEARVPCAVCVGSRHCNVSSACPPARSHHSNLSRAPAHRVHILAMRWHEVRWFMPR